MVSQIKKAAVQLSFVLAFALAFALALPGAAQSAYAATTLDEAAEDVVEFVYVDEQVLAAGESNNIVLGLLDEEAQVASATLVIAPENGGDELVLEASAISDAAMLFCPSFDDDAELGSYVLDRMSYTLEGSDELHVVDLASGDEPYSFEVVSAATASLLESSEASEDGVTVIGLGDDGGIVASASLGDTLAAVADGSGMLSLSSEGTMSLAGDLVIAIDPGHGGSDSGATANGLYEKDLTWKIANYMKSELEAYQGVTVVLTRSENECPGLEERAQRAQNAGASLLVSIHINSGGGTGSEVWVPNSSSYNSYTHEIGEEFAEKVLQHLEDLGLKNRGVKTRNSSSSTYADGSTADYYGVIRHARNRGITGVIVEHAFIDTSSDAAFLSSESNLQSLGVADATAVAEQYGLSKYTPQEEITAPANGTTVYRVYNPNSGLHHLTTSLVEVRYLQSLGWRSEGLSFFAGQATHEGDAPVYRVYNPNDGNHHWTKSEYEYQYLVSIGWNDEGIGWYESSSATTPVWRLYNPNSGEHHYTTSVFEYESVIAAGWNAEGQAWNSL